MAQNQPGWTNNTTHTLSFALNPPLSAPAIGGIAITLTSHNSFPETDDNWDVQGVVVSLLNNGFGDRVILRGSGSQLAHQTAKYVTLMEIDGPDHLQTSS